MKKAKVTGVGGVFFKCNDPDQLKQWYQEQLGFDTDQYGAVFRSRKLDHPNEVAYLQWSPMASSTDHMQPSDKPFMINYRVDDLSLLVRQLKDAGIDILDEIQEFDYGKFVHILDPEGNKIELWEPVDKVFDEFYKQK